MKTNGALGSHLRDLAGRALPGGGFASHPGSLVFRPDVTAWAALALDIWGAFPETVSAARERLSRGQKADGSIPIRPGSATSCWPTAPAVLAWAGAPQYSAENEKAVQFLLSVEGAPAAEDENSPISHNPSIPGWPWVIGTHSWVEPTSLSLLALRATRRNDSDRVRRGVEMLLDRQLPDGGWNYGNTAVYAQGLRPLPYTTGLALSALSGLVPGELVQPGIRYLEGELETLRTPLSLCWGILGLRAWNRPVDGVEDRSLQALENPILAAGHGNVELALLLIAARADSSIDRFASGAGGRP